MGNQGAFFASESRTACASIYNMVKLAEFFVVTDDRLPGGKGDRLTAPDVSRKELTMGIAHEFEHTDDRALAREIAIDHLAEDPRYYSKLKVAGKLLGFEE